MTHGQIVSTDDLSLTVSSLFAGTAGEIRLAVAPDAAVWVGISGFGLGGRMDGILAEPGHDGQWKFRGADRVPPALRAILSHWVCNFALARLDSISHSLTGDRLRRLDTMERLHATMTIGCGVVTGAVSKPLGPVFRDLPAPILIQSAMGPLVIVFGSDRLVDVCIPDPENLSLALGSVRFRRIGDDWRAEPRSQWDITRCEDRFTDDPQEIVRHVMLPMLPRAARHHADLLAAMPPVIEQFAPRRAVAGTVEALAHDIAVLREVISRQPPDARPSYGAPRTFSKRAA